jgi:hypothetical protein
MNASNGFQHTFYLRHGPDGEHQVLFPELFGEMKELFDSALPHAIEKMDGPALYRVSFSRRNQRTHMNFEKFGAYDDAIALASFEMGENGACEIGDCFFDPPEIAGHPQHAQALAFALAQEAKSQQENTHGMCVATAALP